ncbi:FmdB family transcriptional regulator [Betaproteobacteria bacterium GR16-43]|nr:FmdB family transcriptional regulator [Betaproteobacteria bacterium GR16-43]
MPIYEYKCSGCGHQEEFLQKLSDPPQTKCPACGQETFSKMVTAAGFQLKGSGWYVTDFRGGSGAGKATGKPTGASSGESAGDSKSGESKSGESKSGESKSSGSTSGESKPAAAKSETKSESKPASKPAGTGTTGD